ncbi:hypothetical protein Goklo_006181 [Gossypium klotzschianum]|uniref:Uncharacterized protein n=1 Tax=Gossypium klotzschianum TaxID=34286 RepID=A0A7J8VGP7_9ROSI|nr:hypothetical protein [Gossypium klotzschianum]
MIPTLILFKRLSPYFTMIPQG